MLRCFCNAKILRAVLLYRVPNTVSCPL